MAKVFEGGTDRYLLIKDDKNNIRTIAGPVTGSLVEEVVAVPATGDAAVGDVVLGKTFSSDVLNGATGTLVVPDAPTGNAAVGDVAAGKTFSSALLNGATGTSTKNATVPNDAPILPVQAFVDNIEALRKFPLGGLNLSNKGITSFSATLLFNGETNSGHSTSWVFAASVAGFNHDVNLSANALSAPNVNAILAAYVALDSGGFSSPAALDLSGVGMAAPTGQGVTDAATLTNNGWTVTTN